MNSHSSICPTSQKVKATKMPTDRWADTWNVVEPQKGILFSHEKEQRAHMCYHTDELWKHHASWKNPTTIGQSVEVSRRLVVARGWGEEGVTLERRRGFLLWGWNVLDLNSGHGYPTLWMHTEFYAPQWLKWSIFITTGLPQGEKQSRTLVWMFMKSCSERQSPPIRIVVILGK